jgi:hypothetical protein
VEVEANAGYGDTLNGMLSCIPPVGLSGKSDGSSMVWAAPLSTPLGISVTDDGMTGSTLLAFSLQPFLNVATNWKDLSAFEDSLVEPLAGGKRAGAPPKP